MTGVRLLSGINRHGAKVSISCLSVFNGLFFFLLRLMFLSV